MKQSFFPSQSPILKYIFFLCIISILLCLNGCTTPIFKQESSLSPLSSEAILIDDDIYNQVLCMIRSAEQSLYIEQMVLDDPVILNEIVEKAKAGLNIRILLDRWQYENEATMNQLKSNNISAQYYPTEKGQFHRQKFIISDSKTVLFTSSSWTPSHSSFSSLALLMTGDTVQKALESFASDWHYTTTLALEVTHNAYEPEKVTLTSTLGMKSLILSHIEASQQTIWIETQQLSGDDDIINALIAAQKRGCDVRAVLDISCQEVTPNTIKTFADADIQYRFYNSSGKTLNRNFAVFDSNRIIYSSSAWVYNTFIINHEGALSVPSPLVTQKCMDIFLDDWETAIRID